MKRPYDIVRLTDCINHGSSTWSIKNVKPGHYDPKEDQRLKYNFAK